MEHRYYPKDLVFPYEEYSATEAENQKRKKLIHVKCPLTKLYQTVIQHFMLKKKLNFDPLKSLIISFLKIYPNEK